jgi:hypothetical protein
VEPSDPTAAHGPSTLPSQALGRLARSNPAAASRPSPLTWSIVHAARDSNPNRQIRRLVLYVHEVLLSAVCAAQVSPVVQRVPENPSGDGWWTATRTAMTAGSYPGLT